VIEADPVGQAKLAIDDFEPVIRNRVSDRVTCVRIKRGQRSDHRARVVF